MPTALDRVQVLLQPDEYAELKLCAKDERRSLASMSAVLITEALQARIREGTFTPNPNDDVYVEAKERQTRRQLGEPVSAKGLLKELLAEGEGPVIVNNKKERLRMLKEAEATFEEKKKAIEALSEVK